MLKAIISEFNLIRNAIRAGNEYRLQKYGPPETFTESLQKAKEYNEWKKLNTPKSFPFFATEKDLTELTNFKNKFHYWDEWSGSRFCRVENPNFKSPAGKDIMIGSVCRSNPVTGYWEAI